MKIAFSHPRVPTLRFVMAVEDDDKASEWYSNAAAIWGEEFPDTQYSLEEVDETTFLERSNDIPPIGVGGGTLYPSFATISKMPYLLPDGYVEAYDKREQERDAAREAAMQTPAVEPFAKVGENV